jgi:hypothetical protein
MNRRNSGAAVNRPVIAVPGAQAILLSSAPLVFASSISVSDAVETSLTVQLSFPGGTITLDGTTGLSFSVGDGSADATMTFTGTITNINNALSGMSVTAGSTGDRTLSILATNSTGSRSTSVAVQFGSVPANTVAPVVSGDNEVGSTLTCTTGTWTGYPAPTLTYQWYNEGVPISGATSSTYVSQLSDDGDSVTCRVTGTNGYGSDYEDSNEFSVGLSLPSPVLTWTSASSDLTPDFECAVADAQVGDDMTLQISETSDFAVILDSSLNTLDSGEVAAELAAFELNALTEGVYYARVLHERAGWISAYSNTVTVTLSTSSAVLRTDSSYSLRTDGSKILRAA